MAAPLDLRPNPMAIIAKRAKTAPRQQAMPNYALATFVLAGQSDEEDLRVLQVVYADLKEGNKDVYIDLQEEPTPYIVVVCATDEDAKAIISTARELAANYLSGRSAKAKALFVQPPARCKTANFKVAVRADSLAKRVRFNLADVPGPGSLAMRPSLDKYLQEFPNALCEALEKASRFHSSLQLSVHLGYYNLQSYKAGSFSFEQFESMVKHPRAMGHLDTCLRNSPSAGWLSLEAAMSLIRAPNGPCRPTSHEAGASAPGLPIYLLETWHNGDRYETELRVVNREEGAKKGAKKGALKFTLVRTMTVPKDKQVTRFEFTSIGVGRKLGWKIAGTTGNDKVATPQAVKDYLEMKPAEMRGSRDDFRSYPTVPLVKNHKLAGKIKSVAMKSIYQFAWKKTGYVIQFTINRRWQSVRDINKKKATVDFDMTVYAANWDRNCKAGTGQTVGRVWGGDLRGLLPSEAGNEQESAHRKAQDLIKTVSDIRDYFERV